MVFGLITLAATVPLLASSTVQLEQSSRKSTQEVEEDIKTDKCHLAARASSRMSDERQSQLKDTVVVLKNKSLYLHHRRYADHHPFTGYYLPFPEKGYDGLVTTIDRQNMLNWVFIDRDTYQVKHGVRVEAQAQLTGPMDLLRLPNGEKRLGCEGWEGFVAVEQDDGMFALYFDRDDNGLKHKSGGKTVIEVELVRLPLHEYDPVETRSSGDDPD